MFVDKSLPGFDATFARCAADQLMTQLNGLILSMIAVALTDRFTFLIFEQRQVDRPADRSPIELYGRPDIHQGYVRHNQISKVIAYGVFHSVTRHVD